MCDYENGRLPTEAELEVLLGDDENLPGEDQSCDEVENAENV